MRWPHVQDGRRLQAIPGFLTTLPIGMLLDTLDTSIVAHRRDPHERRINCVCRLHHLYRKRRRWQLHGSSCPRHCPHHAAAEQPVDKWSRV